MEISKATVGIVAVACLAGGAAGAYFITRTPQPAAAVQASEATLPSAPAVEQSEAVVAEAPAVAALPSAAEPAHNAAPVTKTSVAPRGTVPAPARPKAQVDAPPAAPTVFEAPVAPLPIEPARVSESVAAAPPEPKYEDLELAAQSVIGLQLESSVTSETARVEDEVVARVTRDVRVGDRVAVPAGSKAHGEVTLVERGGRVRERARLGVRFTSIVLGDGTRVPIDTQPIYREGDSVRNENAAKIGGGAIGGAIIGGILGGAKGAAIGGSIGAGAGTAAVVAQGRNAATLPSGSPVTVRIERPVTVTIER